MAQVEFGENGAKDLAERMNINYLGEVPLVQSIREAGDAGRPAVLQGDTPQAKAFENIIDNTLKKLNITA